MEIGLARLGAAYEPVSQEICPPPPKIWPPGPNFLGNMAPGGGQQCIARAQNCLTSMFVKGPNLAQRDRILEGPNFLGHRPRPANRADLSHENLYFSTT